jgi:hypothetical protein
MPSQSVFQCREQVDSLFAQRGKVTANAAKHHNPVFGTEATGNFLLHFYHPKIALRLIVVKWNSKIVEKAEHRPLLLRESI